MALVPGDLVGEGRLLQGEIIRPVFFGVPPVTSAPEPATEFEVKHILRGGIHDVVYLVQEVPAQEHPSVFGLDKGSPNHPEISYAREYTIRCLIKGDPNSDELAEQMSKVHVIPTFQSSFSSQQ